LPPQFRFCSAVTGRVSRGKGGTALDLLARLALNCSNGLLKKSFPPSLRGAKRRSNPESGREQSKNGCVLRETALWIASLRSQRREWSPFSAACEFSRTGVRDQCLLSAAEGSPEVASPSAS
jgi:hypothetical protein